MSDEASRRKRIIVILIVVIVVYASIYLYIRIQQDRIYNVDITVKPGSLVVKQGEELPFYINSNGAGVPFDVNAYTYLSGLRLDYLGLNDSGSASGSQCFALVKFNLSGSDPDVTAYWNGTIVYLTNSGPRYYLAPAGYYLIGQIVESSPPDTRGNVFMNFTVPHETIFVSGLYLNYYLNLTNDTLGSRSPPLALILRETSAPR
ncbi:hypothetical protein [Thermogymnomonas acidicola]|uniref:hypothetical protein n=1 Tax=Thermogymnomonas acidicola TaxID=399579 RepID=UPI00094656F6|nr:hypothetical protein [Thermogymnomonas acidicola]